MNAKTETTAESASRFDSLKLIFALLLLVAGVAAFYYFAEYSQLMRVLGLLVILGIATAVASQTQIGRRGWAFVRDARTEVRKVVWPTRTETVQTTLMVVGVVIVVGILLWLLDMLLAWAVALLTGQGS